MAPHANANEPAHDPMLVDDATLYEDVEDLTPTSAARPTSANSRRASRTPSNTSSTNRRRRSSAGGNGVPAAFATTNGNGSAPSSKRNSKQLVQSTRRQPFLALGYELHETLGEGEFGKVKLAIHSATRTKVAIKVFKRSRLDDDEKRLKLQREIDILHSVVHQSIVRLFDVVETDDLIGLVIEYASGGELFDYILANRCLPEDEARRLFAQLVEGVHYMHSRNVVHRDLKLENLLLSSSKDLVIIDFGFANQFPPPGSPEHLATHHRASIASSIISTWGGSADRALHVPDRHFLMATSCGSPCYAAPELVIADGYVGTSADVWSCGVILFAMLAGYLPFDDDPENPQGDNITLLYRYILSEPTPLHFPPEMGDDAKDLIARILVPDPERRLTMVEVIEHPWLAPYRAVLDVDYEAPPRVPEKDAGAAAAAQAAPVPRASLLATAAANRASALYVPAAASAETVLAPAAEGMGPAPLARPTSAPTPLHFPPEMGDDAKDLIARILVPDPERRLTMVEVIEHPWLAPYRAVLDVDYEAPPRVPEKDAGAAAAAQAAPVPRASVLATAVGEPRVSRFGYSRT
ncbi:CAMK/CAMKL/KIN4 protein kinase [Allomyces macrogynus ATCC 38327]|uniref:CAMK/CAMKL/KIN4 protein kinase n=1 Tax=Allomyces macrogynus (strain ATCC 38327) TaxID=578462 RepID=A0A0L0SPM1_ALLM3|nr:CAMK/CAMKL/KIN4 protein kinase [Allomyces macrogynus ATCC 38327]|eukprot:KNE64354.1 CAMK/CAMKL/KIN4 protein kinase [Allomyces macrogynus ATCC 38327]